MAPFFPVISKGIDKKNHINLFFFRGEGMVGGLRSTSIYFIPLF